MCQEELGLPGETNDFYDTIPEGHIQTVECAGCGFITVDSEGKKVQPEVEDSGI
jgi:Zn ribbon nucleic-acid-binding protein